MNMRIRFVIASAVAAVTWVSGAQYAAAVSTGLVSTDRFGYTGEIQRFASLADAKAGTGATETIAVGGRDLSLYIVSGLPGGDANIVMGSWWYTTDPAGRSGWGNTRGNTGIGFMQMYDDDGSADTDLAMSFSNFDGTHYRDFTLSLTVENAGGADVSRLSTTSNNTDDRGLYHELRLDLTATGLQGVVSGGLIESLDVEPTGVSGTLRGIFENTTTTANAGFYSFLFDLTMENWAWENRDSLTRPYPFEPSDFVAVVPAPLGLPLIAGAFGVAVAIRRLGGRAT